MALAMEHDSSLAEVSKQAAKALKCVASTSKQVGDMLARKHERILKRIGSISEEIESLKTDVMENITHQRERRLQLTEIEEDVEQAQLLGNGAMVEELLEELRVLKDEAKREDSLYRALCKTVRSRKESKKLFMRERVGVEDEIRTFNCKQKLIQTLLATCTKQSAASDNTQGSSASQSDCGASALEDFDGEDHSSPRSSSSSGSFPENPLDLPMFMPSSPPQKKLSKAVSLEPSPVKRAVRMRSWSSDCVQPLPPREHVQTRTRHSLSVHFASPVLMATRKEADSIDEDLESLDLSGYMASINETPTEKTPVAVEEPKPEESKPQAPVTSDEPQEPTPEKKKETEELKSEPSPAKHLPVPVKEEEAEPTSVQTTPHDASASKIEEIKPTKAQPAPMKADTTSPVTESTPVSRPPAISTSAAA